MEFKIIKGEESQVTTLDVVGNSIENGKNCFITKIEGVSESFENYLVTVNNKAIKRIILEVE